MILIFSEKKSCGSRYHSKFCIWPSSEKVAHAWLKTSYYKSSEYFGSCKKKLQKLALELINVFFSLNLKDFTDLDSLMFEVSEFQMRGPWYLMDL